MTVDECEEIESYPSGPFTGDPVNNVFDRIRILCTDTDNDDILVDQTILEFMYQEAGQDEHLAAAKALTFLMMQIAKMGDEKAGGVYLKNSERIKNMQLVLDDLKAELLKKGIGSVYAGGVSRADILLNRWNPDSVKKGIEIGDSISLSGRGSPVGVVGSGLLYEAPYDIPDECMLIIV